jgi:hypothetical protein
MGNQEKVKGDNCNGDFYVVFQGRVVEDAEGKRRIVTIFYTSSGIVYDFRTPTMDEYKAAVK